MRVLRPLPISFAIVAVAARRLLRARVTGRSTTEANEIASLLRALSHMSPNLLDEQARFGLSVERFADLLAELLIGGLRSRLETPRVKTDADF